MEAVKDHPKYKEISKGKSVAQKTAQERGLAFATPVHKILKSKRESVSLLLWSRARDKLTALQSESFEDFSCPALPSSPSTSSLSQVASIHDMASSISKSLFPMTAGRDRREGPLFCNHFQLHFFDHCTVFSLAHGLGFGSAGAVAAERAARCFVSSLEAKLFSKIEDTKDLSELLIDSLAKADLAISFDKTDVFTAGTTTFLGGAIVELSSAKATPPASFLFTSLRVGLREFAFRYDSAARRFSEISGIKFEDGIDSKDVHGRIGPYLKDGAPDLRSFQLFSQYCHEGDLIILCTDAIYNNLSPEFLGTIYECPNPKWLLHHLCFSLMLEVGHVPANFHDLPSDQKTQLVSDGVLEKLNQLFPDTGSELSPHLVTQALADHACQTTEKLRKWIEANPTLRWPQDSSEFPGSLGHATVLAFKVGSHSVPSSTFAEVYRKLKENDWNWNG